MSFIEEKATETVEEAVKPVKAQPAFLRALMRIAGNKLATVESHEAAAAEHARLSRFHHERTVRWRR